MRTIILALVAVFAVPAAQAQPGWTGSALKELQPVLKGAREIAGGPAAVQSGLIAAILRVTEIYQGRGPNAVTVSPDIRQMGWRNLPIYHRSMAALAAYGLRVSQGLPVDSAGKEEVVFSARKLRDFALTDSLRFSADSAQRGWIAALEEILSATAGKP